MPLLRRSKHSRRSERKDQYGLCLGVFLEVQWLRLCFQSWGYRFSPGWGAWVLHACSGVGCHFLLRGIFLTPGIEPGSPALQAESSLSEPRGKPRGKDESQPKNKKNGEDCMISWRDLKWHELIHLSSKVSERKKRPEFWWLWSWDRFIVCKGELVHGQSRYGSKMMSLWFWQKIKLALFCEKANRLSYYSSVT